MTIFLSISLLLSWVVFGLYIYVTDRILKSQAEIIKGCDEIIENYKSITDDLKEAINLGKKA